MKVFEEVRKGIGKIDALILVAVDALAIFLSVAGVHVFLGPEIAATGLFDKYATVLFPVVTLPMLYFFDFYYTYKDFRRYRQVVNLILTLIFCAAILQVLISYNRPSYLWKKIVFVYCALFFLLTLLDRAIFSFLRRNIFYKNAVIIGTSEISNEVAAFLIKKERQGTSFGIHVAGYLAEAAAGGKKALASFPHLGKLKDIDRVLEEQHVSLIIYGLEESGDSRFNESVVHQKLKGRDLISAIALYEAILGQVPYEVTPSAWLIEECLRTNKFTEIRLKRVLDIIAGAVFLALSVPIMIVCAAVIMLESKGSPLYKQKRVGRFGKLFTIYKLRTMTTGEVLGADHDKWGHLYQANKARVTPFGAFLRKYRIDECPQFLNVIKGDMSLVGPRPEMEVFINKCEKQIPFYRLRLAVRPGITGWAQIWHGHTSTLAGYKSKFKYDLYYLANSSVKLDLEILLRTVFWILGYPRRSS
jgi:exopolysaccharide biosynthesis polyprenyl glycosylphosphotransferase